MATSEPMFKVITHYFDGDSWIDGEFESKSEALATANRLAESANIDIVKHITVSERGYNWHVVQPFRD